MKQHDVAFNTPVPQYPRQDSDDAPKSRRDKRQHADGGMQMETLPQNKPHSIIAPAERQGKADFMFYKAENVYFAYSKLIKTHLKYSSYSLIDNYIQHFLLMLVHVFCIPFHPCFPIQITIEHLFVIVLTNLHHNSKLKRGNANLIRLAITIMF